MNFSIYKLLLVLFVLYIIYTLFYTSENFEENIKVVSPSVQSHEREQSHFQNQQDQQLDYQTHEQGNRQENLADLVKINILEKPQYSIERELIVDDEDTKFYKAHFNEYASDGFDGYGIYTPQSDGELSPEILQKLSKGKKEGLGAWDSTSLDNFATFDRNEKGYLGTNAQNVHSSLVQDTIKNKYLASKKKALQAPSRDTETEIIKFSRYLKKDSGKLQDIINQIKERNSFVKNMNDTEINVLHNSWISANNNVKEQIINELLDITDGRSYIVCPTGVTSRIINANIVENPESSPIKEEDLRKEMLQSASKIRAELDRSIQFQNLSDIDQDHFFKEKLIQKFYNDYDGIISRDRIKKEYDHWIDDI